LSIVCSVFLFLFALFLPTPSVPGAHNETPRKSAVACFQPAFYFWSCLTVFFGPCSCCLLVVVVFFFVFGHFYSLGVSYLCVSECLYGFFLHNVGT